MQTLVEVEIHLPCYATNACHPGVWQGRLLSRLPCTYCTQCYHLRTAWVTLLGGGGGCNHISDIKPPQKQSNIRYHTPKKIKY